MADRMTAWFATLKCRDPNETVSKLTAAGWPRPVHDGWPVPWVSPHDELANMDGKRCAAVRREQLCQVCGCGHEPNSTVVLIGNKIASTARPNTGVEQSMLLTMDDSILHERCARLALARCPTLLTLQKRGHLVVATASIEHVELYVEPGGNEQLGVRQRYLTLHPEYLIPPGKT